MISPSLGISPPLEKAFESWAPISKAAATKDGRYLLHGPAALVAEDGRGPDYDGDDLLKKAVNEGLKTFMRLGGQVDWDHEYDKSKNPKHIIGKCVGVSPNPAGGADIVTTELFQNKELAKAAWEHYQAGGILGYSLKGVAKARDGKRVTGLDIHMMTITPCPKGFEGPRLAAGPAPTLGQLVKGMNSELEHNDIYGWRQATEQATEGPHSMSYEDFEGNDYPTDAEEVIVTDSSEVLKAIADGTEAGVLALAENILPAIVERAIVKAITENQAVQSKIRGIVGGRINKALEDYTSGESISKGTAAAPAGRPLKKAGRAVAEVLAEARQLQDAGHIVHGLADFRISNSESDYAVLVKGVAEARTRYTPSLAPALDALS